MTDTQVRRISLAQFGRQTSDEQADMKCRCAVWKGYWLEGNGKLTDVWLKNMPPGTRWCKISYSLVFQEVDGWKLCENTQILKCYHSFVIYALRRVPMVLLIRHEAVSTRLRVRTVSLISSQSCWYYVRQSVTVVSISDSETGDSRKVWG